MTPSGRSPTKYRCPRIATRSSVVVVGVGILVFTAVMVWVLGPHDDNSGGSTTTTTAVTVPDSSRPTPRHLVARGHDAGVVHPGRFDTRRLDADLVHPGRLEHPAGLERVTDRGDFAARRGASRSTGSRSAAFDALDARPLGPRGRADRVGQDPRRRVRDRAPPWPTAPRPSTRRR